MSQFTAILTTVTAAFTFACFFPNCASAQWSQKVESESIITGGWLFDGNRPVAHTPGVFRCQSADVRWHQPATGIAGPDMD